MNHHVPTSNNFAYYIFYKPYGVLNQFSKENSESKTLADFLRVAKDIYPIGRLDKDSEGLLILTNDKALNDRLLNPKNKHKRVYLVQVDNIVTDHAIRMISEGLEINVDGKIYFTSPCKVKKLPKAPIIPERNPPIRFRQNIPTSWALIELTEGKNRQVRKMFAAVGFPVLRLVRAQIEDVKLGKLLPGQSATLEREELYNLLKIALPVKSGSVESLDGKKANNKVIISRNTKARNTKNSQNKASVVDQSKSTSPNLSKAKRKLHNSTSMDDVDKSIKKNEASKSIKSGTKNRIKSKSKNTVQSFSKSKFTKKK